MTTEVLRVRGLRKRYRGRNGVQANDGIDLDVAAGEVMGLLGHNGAGKTTLVNQIAGLVRPDAGEITLAGIDAIARPDQARKQISVQAQANVPISGLTPRRAIEMVGRIRGGSATEVTARAGELMEALDLGPWADTPAQKVSGGVARLTAFAMAAVQPGPLVVLDEPTNDVDPVRRRLLWQQIRVMADAGHSVLLVTHNVREAERVVDQLAVLDRGVVLTAGPPAALTARLRDRLVVELDLHPGVPITWHPAVTPGADQSGHRASGTVPADSAAAVVEWAQGQVQAGVVERYALTPASLEDVYIDLVGRDSGPAGQEVAA